MSERDAQRWDGEYEFGSPFGDDDVGDAADFDDEDEAYDDDTDVRPCPACGSEVYEESDVCPICGEYILDEPPPPTDQPDWRKFLIVLLIISILLAAGLGVLW